MANRSTEVHIRANAPRDRVYEALTTADSISQWMVSNGMTMTIHEFDGRERGTFRISLTNDSPMETGKTCAHDKYPCRWRSSRSR